MGILEQRLMGRTVLAVAHLLLVAEGVSERNLAV